MHTIDAEYEGGVLRPRKPLRLRPGEQVRIIVMRRTDPARWDLERLGRTGAEEETLAEAGLGAWTDSLDTEDRR